MRGDEMKNLKAPKMTIYNVRMNENIAASGDGTNGYERVHIDYTNGIITRGGFDYWCSGTVIQDTGISYDNQSFSGELVVYDDQVNAISGCLCLA